MPKQSDPTHVKGIKQGNSKGNYERQKGHNPDGTSTQERSTGVPFVIRLANDFPALRRIPARVVGMGIRPEHVRSPEL